MQRLCGCACIPQENLCDQIRGCACAQNSWWSCLHLPIVTYPSNLYRPTSKVQILVVQVDKDVEESWVDKVASVPVREELVPKDGKDTKSHHDLCKHPPQCKVSYIMQGGGRQQALASLVRCPWLSQPGLQAAVCLPVRSEYHLWCIILTLRVLILKTRAHTVPWPQQVARCLGGGFNLIPICVRQLHLSGEFGSKCENCRIGHTCKLDMKLKVQWPWGEF